MDKTDASANSRHIHLITAADLPISSVFGRDLLIKDYRRHLGRSHQQLYWDASDGLHPNAFAAMLGTIEAGGDVLLHLPEDYPNGDPDHIRALDYGRDPLTCKQNFNQRLRHLISAKTSGWEYTDHSPPPKFTLAPQAIIGRRGRGKSTWLGQKIHWLHSQGITNILVIAPYRDNIRALTAAAQHTPFTFLPPDDALYRHPDADYLIIDEASAIPIAQLNALLDLYPQHSLAATTDGYEGHGQRLRLQCLPQRHITIHELSEAHRYSAFDPLEQFTEAAFLLHQPIAEHITAEEITIEAVKRSQLMHSEPLLRQIIALLWRAHYRNTPADLKRLLDLPDQYLWIAKSSQLVIGVLHIVLETPLPSELIQPIISGERRPQGRLLMQQLLRHTQHPDYAEHTLARIQRIATHPAIRRQGIAAALIQTASQSLPHTLGVSYAHNNELAAFWSSQGFSEIYRANKHRSHQQGPTSLNIRC
ncbi:GNAT family N-acetyltransferase [Cardiobacteriaceae bacterium TAE3-ERU3]|nr:GNAT family N-acetyltransferase [Cardiobacteriaceae bacterium TAE3-ERU3]